MAPRRPHSDTDSYSGTPEPPSTPITATQSKKAKTTEKSSKAEKSTATTSKKATAKEKSTSEKSKKGDASATAKKDEETGTKQVEKGDKGDKGDKGGAKGWKDGKEGKEKPVTGQEANKLILEYLRVQNRPFSATEVSANLHGKVTKTVADKLLKELATQGLIEGKGTNKNEKGSQWVFWASQDPSDTATPTELTSMENTITTLKTRLPSLKGDLKTLSTRLHTITSSLTPSEITAKIDALKKETNEKEGKLKALKDGEEKRCTKEEMQETEKEWRFWRERKEKRRRAYLEVEGMVVEQGIGREELRERVGVDFDGGD